MTSIELAKEILKGKGWNNKEQETLTGHERSLTESTHQDRLHQPRAETGKQTRTELNPSNTEVDYDSSVPALKSLLSHYAYKENHEKYVNAEKEAQAMYDELINNRTNNTGVFKKESYESDMKDMTSARRDTLTEQYARFGAEAYNAAANKDLQGYYRNTLLQDKVKEELKQSSLWDFAADSIKNVNDSLLHALDSAVFDVPTAIETYMQPTALSYYHLDDYRLGKPYRHEGDPLFFNDRTQAEEIQSLKDVYEAHKEDDEDIVRLYNYVVNRLDDNIDNREFMELVSHANDVIKTDYYNKHREPLAVSREQEVSTNKLKQNLSYEGNWFANMYLDTQSAVTSMIPSLATGEYLSSIGAPAMGIKAGALTELGGQAGAQAMNEKLAEGNLFNESFRYGAGVGTAEALFETIGGEAINSLLFRNVAKTPIGKATAKAVEKLGIKSKAGKAAIAFVGNVAGEMSEEASSGAFDPVWGNITLGEEIDPGEYIQGIFMDAIEAIPPTIVLMGMGQAQVIPMVNAEERSLVQNITKSKNLTKEQKGEMIRKVQEVAADARLGLTENYDKIVSEVYGQLSNASTQNQAINYLASVLKDDQTMSEEEKQQRLAEFSNKFHQTYNTENQTTQEILDETKPVTVKYSNPDTIQNEIAKALEQESDIKSITPVTNINKALENIKKQVETLSGQQLVYVRSEGGGVHGFTNPITGSNIYIEASNVRDTLAASYHELGHHFKIKFPELYKAFENARKFETNVSDYDREEAFGNYIGQIMTKPENVKAIENKTRTAFENLKEIGNKVSNRVLGTERNNTRISEYNYSDQSYLGTDILNNKELEQQVLNTFKSLKPVDQVKEATKTTEKITQNVADTAKSGSQNVKNITNESEDVDDRITTRYNEMKDKSSQLEIKKMIAEEKGLTYRGRMDDKTSDGRKIDLIYKQLENYGEVVKKTKFSKEISKDSNQGSFSVSEKDSLGRELSKKQQEYFKDSKVRDENGNLLVMYHGTTSADFYTFKKRKGRRNFNGLVEYEVESPFFFFSSDKKYVTDNYGPSREYYLNVTKPLNSEANIKDLNYILEPLVTEEEFEQWPGRTQKILDSGNLYSYFIDENGLDWQWLDDNNVSKVVDRMRELGYDGVYVNEGGGDTSLAVIDANQIKLTNNLNPTGNPDIRFSKEPKKDNIINNQLNEIQRQNAKIDTLKDERKGLRAKNKELTTQIKKDNTSYQRAVKHKGAEIEKLKIKGTRQNAKIYQLNEQLSDAVLKAKVKGYDAEFDRRASSSDIKYDLDDKARYALLRVKGITADKAFKQVDELKRYIDVVNITRDQMLESIPNWFKKSIYNKLSDSTKAEIDEYKKYYFGAKTLTDLKATQILATSDYLKNMQGVILSKNVKNKIVDGLPTELGKVITTKEEAEAFVKRYNELAQKIESELEENHKQKIFEEDKIPERVGKARGEIQTAIDSRKKEKNTTIQKAENQFYTLKSEIQTMFGGNPNAEVMYLNDNLQEGERRKRQILVNIYDMLNKHMVKTSGVGGLMQRYDWKPSIQKAFAQDSKFVKRLDNAPAMPIGLIASLKAARNDEQYMAHVTGAVTSAKAIAGDGFIMPDIVFKEGGGILIPDEKLYREGKISEAYSSPNATIWKPTLAEVDALINTLTEEESNFVDTAREVFDYCGEVLDEVWNRIFGHSLSLPNYFPIRTFYLESPFKSKDIGGILNEYNRELMPGASILNTDLTKKGQFKERQDNSFIPIYGENIVNVLTRTINNIANLYGYAEALIKNDAFLNSNFEEGVKDKKGGTRNSMMASLDMVNPYFMNDYNTLVRYITGAESKGGFEQAVKGIMAQNTLTFNVGTWFTQPASYLNTLKYYKNMGDFIKSLASSHTEVNKMMREYAESQGVSVDKNFDLLRWFTREATPFLDHRALDFRTPVLRSLLGGKWYEKLAQKFDPKMINLFDDIAVSTIVRQLVYDTAQYAKFGTREYFETLGQRIEQVLGETQPDFAQINRPNIARNRNGIAQILYLFGTPSNQIANNVIQSSSELNYTLKNGTAEEKRTVKGKFARMVGGVIASNVWVATVRALRDVIRAKDDDDTEWGDRFAAQFIVSLLSPTLIGDEIASWIMSKMEFGGTNYYELSSPDVNIYNNLVSVADQIIGLFDENTSPTKKAVSMVKAIGTIAPIDTRSLIHITEALLKFMLPDVYKSYTLQNDKTIYKKWSENSDTPMAEFYRAYTATRQSSLETNYGYVKGSKSGTEESKKEAFRRALKDTVPDSEVDKYMEILGGYKK